MVSATVVEWFLMQGGGALLDLAQQQLLHRTGLGSSQLTSSEARLLFEEYTQRLENKLDEDRLVYLNKGWLQLEEAYKVGTEILRNDLLNQALNSFLTIAGYPPEGKTAGFTNAALISMAYIGMAQVYIARGDRQNTAEKILCAVYADSNEAAQALGEQVVQEILAKNPPNSARNQIQYEKILLTFGMQLGSLNSISWSPDGKRIATASENKQVKIWDAFTGTALSTHKDEKSVYAISWSPDGKRLAFAGASKTVHIWDAAVNTQLLTYYGHTNPVHTLIWSPDGKQIASASRDGNIQIWDAATRQILFNSHEHPKLKHTKLQCWLPDGKRMISVDSSIFTWEVTTGKIISTKLRHQAKTAVCSSDGKYLAFGGKDKYLRVWDIRAEKFFREYNTYTSPVEGLAWSPDGKRIAFVSAKKVLHVWDVLTSPAPIIGPPIGITNVRTLIWAPSSNNRIAFVRAARLGSNEVVIIQV